MRQRSYKAACSNLLTAALTSVRIARSDWVGKCGASTVNIAAIRHDILDLCERELVTLGDGLPQKAAGCEFMDPTLEVIDVRSLFPLKLAGASCYDIITWHRSLDAMEANG